MTIAPIKVVEVVQQIDQKRARLSVIRRRWRTTAHVSGGLNISGHKGDGEIFRECARHSEASRRGWSANIASKFRKRSPLFTSVLFNYYSTNAADG
ncbi:hypothetical protein [Bradyrhizobium sp. CCBAU 45384]|uniref:hypothetical protein n=1 Tax=Bradyrhizobium sp. CCBAU 45384 TaxID=858428 RepID=UPI0023066A90|nr:hypothetical protein [Bradyrhizobium sp. CCBAU 45384]MDA9410609.1 hypothetical protein [Bradyrhizobium sp. CCBAU 45384]